MDVSTSEIERASADLTEPAPPARRLLIGAIGGLIALGLLVAQWNIDGNRRIDFRIYSRAIRAIGHRGLYQYGVGNDFGFTYPPFAALVLTPITWLGETVSSHVWLVVSTVISLAISWSILRIVDVDRPVRRFRPIVASLALWASPVFYSLRLGQINALVVGLICVDVVLISRDDPSTNRFAGIGTGVAAALKVTPLGMIAFLLLSRRKDVGARAVGSFLGATALAAIVLPNETRRYWTGTLFDSSRVGPLDSKNNVSLSSVIVELTSDHAAQTALWIVCSAALFVVAARKIRHAVDGDPVGAFTVGMCWTYAATPITWVHHHWFTVIALGLWTLRARRPVDWVIIGIAAIGLLDRTAFAEDSMITATIVVAFLVATIVALPAPTRRLPPTAEPAASR